MVYNSPSAGVPMVSNHHRAAGGSIATDRREPNMTTEDHCQENIAWAEKNIEEARARGDGAEVCWNRGYAFALRELLDSPTATSPARAARLVTEVEQAIPEEEKRTP